jgi:metal transporter CNNM
LITLDVAAAAAAPRRGQLKALVDIHAAEEGLGGPLLADEIKVMCGALDLTHKTART